MIAIRSQISWASAEIVGGEQDRVSLLLHAGDLGPQVAPGLRIQAGRRLIEEHQFRCIHECQRQRESLALTARERVECGIRLLGQREAGQQRLGLGANPVERSEQPDRLARRDAALQRRGLQRGANSLPDLARMPARIDAADLDMPRIRRAQADHAFKGGGLAGAVGTDQAEDLAVFDVEADAARRVDVSVAFLEIANDDFGAHAG